MLWSTLRNDGQSRPLRQAFHVEDHTFNLPATPENRSTDRAYFYDATPAMRWRDVGSLLESS